MRVLVLGGTSEASMLASLLAGQSGISGVLSFAGRTKAPRVPEIPYRSGGFGGAAGLAAYLKAECIDVLVDATHPFAEQMSRHATQAAACVNIPLVSLARCVAFRSLRPLDLPFRYGRRRHHSRAETKTRFFDNRPIADQSLRGRTPAFLSCCRAISQFIRRQACRATG